MLSGRVNLVVALRTEAQPLIDHLGMSPVSSGRGFRSFVNSDRGLALVLSGVGRSAAAAAAAYLGRDDTDPAWLNVGIAGHRSLPIGSARMAHKVHCAASARSWYPPIVFEPPCPTATVRTVDRATRDFPTDDLYDMEAAGFYEIAARFAPHELVHSFKVVSDNLAHKAETLTADSIESLIGDNLETIDALIEPLRRLSAERCQRRVEPRGLGQLLQAFHFTTTHRRQLRRLLRRWSVVCAQVDAVDWVASRALSDAGSVIASMRQHLEGVAPKFPPYRR